MPLTKVTKSLITSVDVSQINTSAGDAGKVLTSNGSTLGWTASGGSLTSGTAVTLTNQTSVDFTGIPSTAKRITVMMSGISTSGTSNIQIQVGSTTITTSGYVSQAWSSLGSGVTTSGLILTQINSNATYSFNAVVVLSLLNNNIWISNQMVSYANTNSNGFGGNGVTPSLASALDRIRLTTINGADTFDAGTVNIMWE
jgi:hypothetical protein